jgi:phenylalanyl-tRNA synthetase beta chain
VKNGSEYLNKVELLDEYRGDSIPEHQTSLCIQLTFQSSEKTLVTKEIDDILNHCQMILKTEYSVDIRL